MLPTAPSGRGLTPVSGCTAGSARAAAPGYVEAPSYPFIGEQVFDQLGLAADDPARRREAGQPAQRRGARCAPPCCPGCWTRSGATSGEKGTSDVGLFEVGLVFRPGPDPLPAPPPASRRPAATADELAALDALRCSTGSRRCWAVIAENCPAGGGAGRETSWADAVEVAELVARQAGFGSPPCSPTNTRRGTQKAVCGTARP